MRAVPQNLLTFHRRMMIALATFVLSVVLLLSGASIGKATHNGLHCYYAAGDCSSGTLAGAYTAWTGNYMLYQENNWILQGSASLQRIQTRQCTSCSISNWGGGVSLILNIDLPDASRQQRCYVMDSRFHLCGFQG